MKRYEMVRRFQAAAVLLAVFAVLLVAAGAVGYASLFSSRVATPEANCYREEQFPGLVSKPVSFSGHDGIPLSGHLYSSSDKTADGLVVLAHGMGFGHRAYMNVAAFFADNGYFVFSYDATGYDESGGTSTRGVQQVLLDLDSALNTAESLPETEGLPVFLFGHSLGGYAVCAVLPMHPEVQAVAALAGFDSTSSLLRARFGFTGSLLTPGALLWERIRFGEAANSTSMRGFASSDAKVLIAHSVDDPEVPIACGLERYVRAYGDDPRFLFLRLDGKGHGGLFTDEVSRECLALFDSCVR